MEEKNSSAEEGSSERDIQSVKRALDILEAVATGELGVTEISKAVGLHVATVHNLLRTLAKYHYLENRGGRYRLGASAAILAERGNSAAGLSDLIQPWLEKISRETGEAASASILSGEVLRIVAFQPGTQAITIHFPQWVWPQPLCLATGRLLVAELPETEWGPFVADGAPTAPKWSEDDWTRELQTIRAQGYSIISNPSPNGQVAMAMPVRSRSGRMLVAVGASAPSFRVTPELCACMFTNICNTAVELSRQFGCPVARLAEIEKASMPKWKQILAKT